MLFIFIVNSQSKKKTREINLVINFNFQLKLVRTPLNYRILGPSAADIYLSNDHSF